MIENIAREDLGVIEEARTIAALLDELDVTATSLARRLGRSRSDLVHTVRLLDLPDEAIELIDKGALSKGHGKVLLTEPDHCRRRTLARRAAAGPWSVRALETEIARATQPRPRPVEPHPDQVAAAARLHDVLARATGCEIQARPHRLGYQIILDHAAVERLTIMLLPLVTRGEVVPPAQPTRTRPFPASEFRPAGTGCPPCGKGRSRQGVRSGTSDAHLLPSHDGPYRSAVALALDTAE